MQKDRKKNQAQIFDDECICRSFYGFAFGSSCQKRRKEYFFCSNAKCASYLMIWYAKMSQKNCKFPQNIDRKNIFIFHSTKKIRALCMQALKPNTKCINIWKICMMLWMCTYMLEYSPKKTFWHLTVALRVGKMRNSLFKYGEIFDTLC